MRLVVDINILVSALITDGGNADRLWKLVRAGRATLISSVDQIDEFARVTRYPRVRKYILPADAGTMLNHIRSRAEILRDLPNVSVSADPADNFLLAIAAVGNADYLVSGDRRGVLALGRHGATKIVTLRAILALLGEDSPSKT